MKKGCIIDGHDNFWENYYIENTHNIMNYLHFVVLFGLIMCLNS